MTLEDRCKQRVLLTKERFAIYRGREHDLYIALPDEEKLQSNFEIRFDVKGILTPTIVCKRKKYLLNEPPLRTEDKGYYCIQAKFKGSKGLHKIPLHRLAYVAFYGTPPPGWHIHHIDRDRHNNAASNLVALTEEEHCEAHKRDVSVPRNLFTKQKPKGLLASIQQEADRAIKQVDDPSLKEVQQMLVEPKLLRLLLAPYSEEALKELIDAVTAVQLYDHPTVIEYICKLLKGGN